ncbi:MAG: NrtA/SsuA/CpmA family ABC transporter substrate-binding protein [Deltaproteobacteria bacterium]|nr:NrtA/SsuA/CpmA family ABC transporter substrate-binding protein [Deltaproteobacteria bacterium]
MTGTVVVRTGTSVALLIVTFSLLWSCAPKTAGPPEKVTIAVSRNPNACLVHIASSKNYFVEEGLAVTLHPCTHGKAALEAMLEGKADIGTVGDTPITLAAIEGKPIRVLAAIMDSDRDTVIVGRKDRGISRPADLKGKRIAVTRGTTGDFFLNSFLTTHGIATRDVSAVDLVPGGLEEALIAGKVDAASTWNPHAIRLRSALGEGAVTFFSETIYPQAFGLVSTRDYIGRKPEVIPKVLRALIRAETFQRENPDRSQGIVADAIGTDKDLIRKIWPFYNFRVTLDQSLIINMENQARWAIGSRMTEKRQFPNFLQFIHPDCLVTVKPEAVTVIRQEGRP